MTPPGSLPPVMASHRHRDFSRNLLILLSLHSLPMAAIRQFSKLLFYSLFLKFLNHFDDLVSFLSLKKHSDPFLLYRYSRNALENRAQQKGGSNEYNETT